MVYSLKEVLFAVHAVPPAEALLGQLGLAVAALEALAVPVAVQHLEDEAVHDVLVAARTHWDLWGGGTHGFTLALRKKIYKIGLL